MNVQEAVVRLRAIMMVGYDSDADLVENLKEIVDLLTLEDTGQVLVDRRDEIRAHIDQLQAIWTRHRGNIGETARRLREFEVRIPGHCETCGLEWHSGRCTIGAKVYYQMLADLSPAELAVLPLPMKVSLSSTLLRYFEHQFSAGAKKAEPVPETPPVVKTAWEHLDD